MKDIEQCIPAGYCIRCRGCCRFSQSQGPWVPHLLAEEKKQLAQLRVIPCPSGTEIPFRCSELDSAANTCAVYPSRPLECRLYPFLLNITEARFFLAADTNCPYVQEQQGNAGFLSFAARLAACLQTAEWRAVLRANRHVFQAYPGVRDLVELVL